MLPRTVDVRTGAQQAAKKTSDLESNLSFLRTFLLIFAYVSLVVGAFIIFNTFSITVAQRTREFGLLRTLGASRGQIMRSVVVEGLLLGVVGAVLGLLAGIALGAGARPAVQGVRRRPARQRHGARDAHDRRLAARRHVVTVLAGLLPALRATRVPPLAAMREGVEIPPRRWSPAAALIAGSRSCCVVVVLRLVRRRSAQGVGFVTS